MPEKAKINSGIYMWKNTITNQVLIGQALHLRRQKGVHICTANKGSHHNSYFQAAWNKYGESSFEFQVLEYIENPLFLTSYEQSYLDYYRSLPGGVYNLKGPVDSPLTGVPRSITTRAKISASNKGKKRTTKCIQRMRDTFSKQVIRTCPYTGNEVIYSSLSEAIKDGFILGSISRSCYKLNKLHRGYYWSFGG